jgi:hypothetical protein
MPVILILYDAKAEEAYWLHVQEYFTASARRQPPKQAATTSVHLPRENALNEEAIRRFARYRNEVMARIKRVLFHEHED